MRTKLLIAAGVVLLFAGIAAIADPKKPEAAGKGAAQKEWAQERREVEHARRDAREAERETRKHSGEMEREERKHSQQVEREERQRLEERERERRGPPEAS